MPSLAATCSREAIDAEASVGTTMLRRCMARAPVVLSSASFPALIRDMEILERIWEIIAAIGNGILGRFERAVTGVFARRNHEENGRFRPARPRWCPVNKGGMDSIHGGAASREMLAPPRPVSSQSDALTDRMASEAKEVFASPA